MTDILNPPSARHGGPAAGAVSPGGAKAFDLALIKQYFHVVVKRVWLLALCFVIAVTVVLITIMKQIPVYNCRATLLLSYGLPVPSSLTQAEILPRGEYMDTQQLILQSGLLISRAKGRLNRSAADLAKIRSVSCYQVGKTAFLAIEVQSEDPVLGAEMANALAEEFLDFKSEERLNTSQATVISLTQQANRLHEELNKAEEHSLEFARENNVIAIQERGNIAAQHLASLSAQAAEFRTERMFLESEQPLLAKAADDTVLAALTFTPGVVPGMGYSSIGTISSEKSTNAPAQRTRDEGLVEYGMVQQPGWESLKRQNAMLQARLVEYRKKFRDAHPLIQKTLADLQENDQASGIELQFALRQYYAQLESLSIKEQAAKRVEQEWEEEALEIARKAQESGNIQRNFSRLQNLYDLVFNRLKEIDISSGIEPESVRIMERATPSSSPIAPRKMQSIFMAALVGLGLGLGLIFGIEYIDDSIRYPDEVARHLGLPFFGLVPAANWDPDDLRTHVLANLDQKSGVAEAYRNIRSSILFSGIDDRIRTIALTSAVPKEGKTTTCLNLAVSLAQAGSRVLVVDGDLRRGELHKFFGLEGGRGFSDVLVGQAKPDAVIQRTGIPNLDLVATGPFPPNPAEVVLRPELGAFFEYAKRIYDRILIDCPPVMAVSEAAILASLAEGSILIVWAGHTSRKLCALALQVLRERGANVLGCVLNNLDMERVGYYYYSTYYGYYDYDYVYGRKDAGRPG